MYDQEIKNMNQKIQELQKTKKELLKSKKSTVSEDQLQQLGNKWEIEKEKLNKEREDIKA